MSEHTKTWRVKWRSSLTGATGHGTTLFYRHEAERYANAANANPRCRGVQTDIEDTQP